MGFWPLYRENILQGPSHVSLALPGIPSAISKSVNGTMPAMLLFPNLDFLKSFVKGDVGIAQGIMTNSLLANINSASAANNEMVARKFAEVNKLDIKDIDKYKDPTGKIKIPKSDIIPSTEFDMTGLKATEKTIITSIFETQKPYMEISKMVVDLMVKSEDIVARIMPLLSVSPLTSKSERPTAKDGKSNGTKAIGYRNGEDIKKILAELEKVSKIGGKLTVNKDGTTSKDKTPAAAKTDESDLSEKDLQSGKKWKILSTVYSTGDFNPDIEYIYSYNILPPDDEGPNNLTPEDADEDNPFDKYKPKKIILGIFDSDGKPLDPNQTLKAKGLNGNEVAKIDTQIKVADWVFRSPKWKFAENQYIWPSFGGSSGDPIYLWTNILGITKESKKSPGKGWSIKKYKKGDKNIINNIDAIEGDPVIAKFDKAASDEYLKYFTEYTKQKTKTADGLTQAEKDAVVKDIIGGFDIQSHLQNVFLYGSGKSSTYKAPGIPEAMKIAFKPYQIYVPEALGDPKLSGDGMIWIDPEADYEFKVIRVDPVSKAKGDPTKAINEAFTTDKLFSNGRYGTGTAENPQEIEIIKRDALTDLDTQSYYIIEGIAVDENNRPGGATNANASGDSGGKWYRLPHAIGVAIIFLKMLIDLAIKLFPAINKLLKLFSDPTKFVTDIITEKVGEHFAIFSPEAFEKIKQAKKILDKKDDIINQAGRISDFSDQMKRNIETSPLINHVHVDQFSIPGKLKMLPDGVAMIPFEIFGKSIPFGMELKLSNLVPEVPNINIPKIPQVEIPKVSTGNLPDVTNIAASAGSLTNIQAPNITAPSVSLPKVEVPNIGIPSITLPKVQSPIRLITGKIGKAKSKGCGESEIEGDGSGNSELDKLNNPAQEKNSDKRGQTKNENDRYVTTTWYSTGQFIKGVDYNYFYITDDTARILKDVDDLINSPDGTPPLPENLQLAKEMLENALKKDPDNEALKSKLDEIKSKILDAAMSTQPILKLALGMVATPIKVISCIIQWIMDFFKSLKNPMMLPAKIIELLSFKWIMKFFSPQGLLKTAGVDFNPSIINEYASLAKIPNSPGFSAAGSLDVLSANIPKVPQVKIPDNLGSLPNITAPNITASNITVPNIPTPNITAPNITVPNIPTPNITMPNIPKPGILNNIKPHNGKYAIPDSFELANLSKFINVSFMANLPTYSSKDIRENADFPKQFSTPVLCLIEKLINAFIDFVWSTLGIEAVIPPPHIKLCKEKTPEDMNKLLNGEKPTNATDGNTEVVSTNPYEEKKATDDFIYEVKLPDGKVVTLLNKEDLDKFIQENKDIGYDFQF